MRITLSATEDRAGVDRLVDTLRHVAHARGEPATPEHTYSSHAHQGEVMYRGHRPRLDRLFGGPLPAALCAALLAACGGGLESEPAETLAAPSQAVLDAGQCSPQAAADGAAQKVDARCVRSSPVMRAHARPRSLDAGVAAVEAALTPDQLMNWAEKQFPELFAPADPPTLLAEPYTYRHYPATGNYIGVAGADIYVLGPISQGQIAHVGKLDDYACVAANIGCAVPGAPTITRVTPHDTSAIIEFSAPSSSGSSPITLYKASCSSGFDSIGVGSGSSSPVTVTGLTNGRRYSCIVTADNQQGTSAPSAAATVTPAVPRSHQMTKIRLASDAGDYIGGGLTYDYDRTNAQITLVANANLISIRVNGNEWWDAQFVPPAGLSTWTPGTYTGLARYPFHDSVKGGLSWGGEGRGCNTLTGSITVTSATYTDGALDSVNLSFVQQCEGQSAALRGTVAWGLNDPTRPPGPVVPVPANLWRPPAAALPATGNYAYLQSDAGDYIGQGKTSLHLGQDAPQVIFRGTRLTVQAGGYEGDFVSMDGTSPLMVGYYAGLSRYPFHNPYKGGLSWGGNGRGCNELSGWFAVDDITIVDNQLQHVVLRFEQHCEGDVPALRGQIRWTRP